MVCSDLGKQRRFRRFKSGGRLRCAPLRDEQVLKISQL
jgi:hypothetical protein